MTLSFIPGLRWKIVRSTSAVFLSFCFLAAGDVFANGKWYAGSSVDMGKGKFIYDRTSYRYSWNLNFRYSYERFGLYVTIPVVFQNTNLMTRSAGMLLPANHNSRENVHAGNRHGNLSGPSGNSGIDVGTGDVSFYSEYRLLRDANMWPSVSVSTQFKFPTASREMNIGTGELDFGIGLLLRKQLDEYALFADMSYLKLGDPAQVNYLTPIYWGAGMRKIFDYGRYTISNYYSQSSTVINGFDGFREISDSIYHSWNDINLSAQGGLGLNATTPAFSFSLGFETVL